MPPQARGCCWRPGPRRHDGGLALRITQNALGHNLCPYIYIYVYVSVVALASRISFFEYNVNALQRNTDSTHAVLAGTTTVNGPVFLSGPMELGGAIACVNVSVVAGLQPTLDAGGSD